MINTYKNINGRHPMADRTIRQQEKIKDDKQEFKPQDLIQNRISKNINPITKKEITDKMIRQHQKDKNWFGKGNYTKNYAMSDLTKKNLTDWIKS